MGMISFLQIGIDHLTGRANEDGPRRHAGCQWDAQNFTKFLKCTLAP